MGVRESFDSMMDVIDNIAREDSDSEIRKAKETEREVEAVSLEPIKSEDVALSTEDNLTERMRKMLLKKLPESLEKLSSVTNELTSILLLLKSGRLPHDEASKLFQAKFAELGKLLSV